jgi:hypothetical protein
MPIVAVGLFECVDLVEWGDNDNGEGVGDMMMFRKYFHLTFVEKNRVKNEWLESIAVLFVKVREGRQRTRIVFNCFKLL